eukprot:scaffold40006_cov36-Prasinocladus_malaysianus.AAC.1
MIVLFGPELCSLQNEEPLKHPICGNPALKRALGAATNTNRNDGTEQSLAAAEAREQEFMLALAVGSPFINPSTQKE